MIIFAPPGSQPTEITLASIREKLPNVSYSTIADLAPFHIFQTIPTQQPETVNPRTERIEQAAPVLTASGWEDRWVVRPATQQEIAEWDANNQPQPDWTGFAAFTMTFPSIMQAMQAARTSLSPPGEPAASSLPAALIEAREGRYHVFQASWQLVLQCAISQGANIGPEVIGQIVQKAQESHLPTEFIATLIPGGGQT